MMSHYVTIDQILGQDIPLETSVWTLGIAEEAAAIFQKMEWTWGGEIPDKFEIDHRIAVLMKEVCRILRDDKEKLQTSVYAGRLAVMGTRSTNGEIRLEALVHYNLGNV